MIIDSKAAEPNYFQSSDMDFFFRGEGSFFGPFIVSAAAGMLLFRFFPGAGFLKRLLFPFYFLGLGLWFGAFCWRILGSSSAFVIVALLLAIGCIVTIRYTRFCDACGRMIYNKPGTRWQRVCKCGAELR